MFNIQRQIDVFKSHTAKFDLTVDAILRKHEHTLGTVDVAKMLCEKLKLDDRNTYLAMVIALLHDYARFEQWQKYQTYQDVKSFDHGDRACELLFGKGEIRHFEIPPEFYPAIRYAVKNHNKYQICTDSIPICGNFDVLFHAKLIRDVDKIDIARIIIAYHRKETGPIFPGPCEPTPGISPKVIDAITKGLLPGNANARTIADGLLCNLGYALDLETDAAKDHYIKNDLVMRQYMAHRHRIHKQDRNTVHALALHIAASIG